MKRIIIFIFTALIAFSLSECGSGTLNIEMAYVQGGVLQMGKCGDGECSFPYGNTDYVRTETVASFNIGRYLVTQLQYKTIMGYNPSYYTVSSEGNSDNLPVENITWFDAAEFCNKLSIKEGLIPVYTLTNKKDAGDHIYLADVEINLNNNGYRLPTEAEWEFAAKGGILAAAGYHGVNTNYYIFSGSNNVDDVAWYRGSGSTHEVGKKAPNELGLYDMSGNVQEWCWDPYENVRVLRGGSFFNRASNVRSAYRSAYNQRGHHNFNGFRLVRSCN